MPLVTREDFRDIYLKFYQRGLGYLLSKFNWNGLERTRGSFNVSGAESSNWWIIEDVQRRWNQMITGDADVAYEDLLTRDVFAKERDFQVISIGSGVCFHELRLARLNPHGHFTCVDISEHLLDDARQQALSSGVDNISFIHADLFKQTLPRGAFDVVFFHASLHHFSPMGRFLDEQVLPLLKPRGKLIINEYVGPDRLQFGAEQIAAINTCLALVPASYRQLFKSRLIKNRYYGCGRLRMFIQDPSECADSSHILSAVHERFRVVLERPYGGNLLMGALKDVSHHFVPADTQAQEVLRSMFACEDAYLRDHNSDYVFGVYELAC